MKPARRHFVAAAGAALLSPLAVRAAAAPAGEVQPRLPPPALTLRDADDRPLPLRSALQGKATAVQLMFTGCSTTCPPQAALFAAIAAAGLPATVQLLSISIDVLGDTPTALSQWLARFGGPAGWRAAVPAAADLASLVGWLRGPGARHDAHTSQVFLVDARGCLCYRSGDLPPARSMVAALDALSRGG